MRYLIDTHVLLWQFLADPRLAQSHINILNDTVQDIVVSDVSICEIAIKMRTGKLRLSLAAVDEFIEKYGYSRLAITRAHLNEMSVLPRHHGDPVDALLIAQARVESMVLMTGDRTFARYDVEIA